jgi:hypothetical protein
MRRAFTVLILAAAVWTIPVAAQNAGSAWDATFRTLASAANIDDYMRRLSARPHLDEDGVYHSIYDDMFHFTKFLDTDFRYGRALAQKVGTAVIASPMRTCCRSSSRTSPTRCRFI